MLFAALHRYCHVRLWRPPQNPLNVVITGGSKGLGKALAREFLQHGDHIIITGRSEKDLAKTIADLRSELSPEQRDLVSITGTTCDICKPEEVEQLAKFAQQHFGNIDVWVCNAGYSGGFKSFLEIEPETIAKVSFCSSCKPVYQDSMKRTRSCGTAFFLLQHSMSS